MTEHHLAEGSIDYSWTPHIPPAVQDGFWPRMQMVTDLVRAIRHPDVPVVDLGCNGGHLLNLVGKPCWGYDIARHPLTVALAELHDARLADITTDDLELAPIVTICEVLEHLADPHAMVRRLNVDPVEYVVASGPYQETPADHYEQHLWAWDQDGFIALFEEAGFQVIQKATKGIFQAVVAVR